MIWQQIFRTVYINFSNSYFKHDIVDNNNIRKPMVKCQIVINVAVFSCLTFSQHGDAAGNIWDKVWDFVYNQVKNLWDAMDLGITKPVSLFLQYLAPVICYAFYHIIKFRFVGAGKFSKDSTYILYKFGSDIGCISL